MSACETGPKKLLMSLMIPGKSRPNHDVPRGAADAIGAKFNERISAAAAIPDTRPLFISFLLGAAARARTLSPRSDREGRIPTLNMPAARGAERKGAPVPAEGGANNP